MALLASILMASAAVSQPVYPTNDVLSELKAICFTDYRTMKRQGSEGPVSDAVEFWVAKAKSRGWVDVSKAENGSSRDIKVLHFIRSLDYALFGSFSQPWSSMDDRGVMLGGQLFKKSVSGRMLYLSAFGADDGGGRTVGECRIHDPLGDGVKRNPISARDVQNVVGAKVRRFSGPFSSIRYGWAPERGQIAQLDIHFGFKGWRLTPFDRKIGQFDPYVPYGLTLVAGFHEEEIIV